MIKFGLLGFFCLFSIVSWVFRGKKEVDRRKVSVILSLYLLGDKLLK